MDLTLRDVEKMSSDQLVDAVNCLMNLNYGTTRHWIITRLVFDLSPDGYEYLGMDTAEIRTLHNAVRSHRFWDVYEVLRNADTTGSPSATPSSGQGTSPSSS